MSDKTVSVIIPYYNEPELLRQCLRSIYSNTVYSPFEAIVVDDGSPDHAVDKLRGEFVWARFIRKERNGGFAASCNSGADAASGRYLLFLNHDTTVTRGWMSAMVKTLADEPAAGIVGSKLVYPDSELIQHAGGVYRREDGLWILRYKRAPASYYLVNRRCEVQWVTGACLMIERNLFYEAGKFDPRDMVEDQDLCFQVRRKGYRVIYCPESTVYHIQDSTDIISFNLRYWYNNFVERWRDYMVLDDEDMYSGDGFDPKFVNGIAALGEGWNFNYVLTAIDLLGTYDAESQQEFIAGKSQEQLIQTLLARLKEKPDHSTHEMEMFERLKFTLGVVRLRAGHFTEADMLFSSTSTEYSDQSYPHERMIMLAVCDIGRKHFRRAAYRLSRTEFADKYGYFKPTAMILQYKLSKWLGRTEQADTLLQLVEEYIESNENNLLYKLCRKLVDVAELFAESGMDCEAGELVWFLTRILARCEARLQGLSTLFAGGHRYSVCHLLANAGSLYERLGRRAQALELYKHAHSLIDDSCRELAVSIHFHLGTLNFESGQYIEARRQLERTLALEPDHGKAKELLDQLTVRTEATTAAMGGV